MSDEAPSQSAAFLDQLEQRHLLHQCTDREGLAQHLDAAPRRLYNGFDPTADSLTIGNLVPIMLLRRFRDAGHTPVVLQGGATGLIGDPSGKESERSLRTVEQVQANLDAQAPIFRALLGDDVRIVNNHDWFKDIDAYTFLRDIGKHFSVSQMIARDSIRNRLEREQGISYTEFSYMLLQAYDFLHLYKADGITLQTAGADQWGNIVSGCDLIRRSELSSEDEAETSKSFGLTAPLLTKSDGSKFGKTESGAIWLSHKRPVSNEPGTSPYAYFQFWLNTADGDVSKYLRIFTDRPLDEIEHIDQQHAAEPFKRDAQRTLARDATTLLHGRAATENAENAAKALFSGDVKSLDADTLDEVFAEVPSTNHDRSTLDDGGGDVIELLAATSLVSSKGEARKQLAQNAVAVNGEKIDADTKITRAHLLHDRVVLLRRGKKNWHVCRFA